MKYLDKILDVLKSEFVKRNLYIFLILLIVIFIFVPYISRNFIYGEDYICHVANVYAINENMSWNNLSISKIRSSIANNLGYGNGLFYPQFAYYIMSYIYFFMKKLGFSMISSIKVYEFVLVFLSGIAMYQFMQRTFENKRASLVSSITYICAPYFITDIFRRMAIAEVGIFLFMPIVMLSIVELFRENYKKFAIFFILGYSGMIVSHLVLTVYFTILLAIFLVVNITKILNKKAIFYLIATTLIVLAITSPFWGPMLEHKIRGEYVVFANDTMTDINKISHHRLSLLNFVKSNDELMTTHISLITLLLIVITTICSYYLFKRLEDSQKRILSGMYIFLIISIIITLNCINWAYVPRIFWLIQFPWRMCSFVTFSGAVIAGIATILIKKDSELVTVILIFLIAVVSLLEANTIINKNELRDIPDVTYAEVSNIFDRGLGDCEYLPINGYVNIYYLAEKEQKVALYDNAEKVKKVEVIESKTPYFQFEIEIEDGANVVVEIPRLFYYGYSIKLKDKLGNVEKLDYWNNVKGLISIGIDKSGTVTVDYTGTIINKICNIVSICTILGCIVRTYWKK